MDPIHQSKDVKLLNRLKTKRRRRKTNIYVPTETNSKGIVKKFFRTNGNKKKSEVLLLKSHKIYLITKTGIENKEKCCIIIV